MSTPAPVVSNPVTVTEDSVAPSISLTQPTPTEVQSGATLTLAGTVVAIPDGSTIGFQASQDGGTTFAAIAPTAPVSGGAFSATYVLPANSTGKPINWVFEAVFTPSPPPAGATMVQTA